MSQPLSIIEKSLSVRYKELRESLSSSNEEYLKLQKDGKSAADEITTLKVEISILKTAISSNLGKSKVNKLFDNRLVELYQNVYDLEYAATSIKNKIQEISTVFSSIRDETYEIEEYAKENNLTLDITQV